MRKWNIMLVAAAVAAIVQAAGGTPVAWADGGTQVFQDIDTCARVTGKDCERVVGGYAPTTVPIVDGLHAPGGTQGPTIKFHLDIAQHEYRRMQTSVSGTEDRPVVAMDFEQVAFPDAQPTLDHVTNRVMVPLRFASEHMGAQVLWDNGAQTVTITKNARTIVLHVGDTTAEVNGQAIQFDAPAVIVPPGRIMVPIRFLAEAFGGKVDWVGGDPTKAPDTGWGGKYQVWIWPADGYWGPYNFADRSLARNWSLRRQEAQFIVNWCQGKVQVDANSVGDDLTGDPTDDMRPQCPALIQALSL